MIKQFKYLHVADILNLVQIYNLGERRFVILDLGTRWGRHARAKLYPRKVAGYPPEAEGPQSQSLHWLSYLSSQDSCRHPKLLTYATQKWFPYLILACGVIARFRLVLVVRGAADCAFCTVDICRTE